MNEREIDRLVRSGGQALQNLGMGTYSAKGEKLGGYSYYDTATLAAATLVHRLFTQPVGGLRNLDTTNMQQGGQIPQGQLMVVRAIKIMYIARALRNNATYQNILDFMDQTTLSVIIQGKAEQLTLTAAELFGLSLAAVAVPTVAGDNLSTPHGARSCGIYPLNTPIVLAALTPFEVRMEHHAATAAGIANDRVRVSLNGTLYRAN